MEKTKPIKRSAAIVEFSRDHHFALLLLWKIREGLKNSIEPSRIGSYVIHFFDQDLIPHFQAEEEILFSRLPKENALRLQAEEEHRNIYRIMDAMKKNPAEPAALDQFTEALESHIRFEERELFNYLQDNISEAELSEIASWLKARTHDPGVAWSDTFWDNKRPKK